MGDKMVLIISKTFNKQNVFDEMIVINAKIQLIDDYHILYNNEIIEFDYLLCDNLELISGFDKTNVLMDETPVTNYFGQTSTEHIYIGDLDISIDHLINGE